MQYEKEPSRNPNCWWSNRKIPNQSIPQTSGSYDIDLSNLTKTHRWGNARWELGENQWKGARPVSEEWCMEISGDTQG